MCIHTGGTPHIPLFDNAGGVVWIPADKPQLAEKICAQMLERGFHFIRDWFYWQRGIEAKDDTPETNPEYVIDQVWVCEDMEL